MLQGGGWVTYIHLDLLAIRIFDGRVVGFDPDILDELGCEMPCFSG